MPTDTITRETLLALGAERPGPCVSIFMPAKAAGPEVHQDAVRLSSLLQQAEDQLVAAGCRRSEAARMLAEAPAHVERLGLWEKRGSGLAVFVAPGQIESLRVPSELAEGVIVSRRFNVRPLLSLLETSGSVYVLALSMNTARLLEMNMAAVREVDVAGMPPGAADLQQFDDSDVTVQSHASGARTPMYHGQGAAKDARANLRDTYIHAVEHAVTRLIQSIGAPLVLMGTAELVAAYRRGSRYPNLSAREIAGNPDRVSAQEVFARAWALGLEMVAETSRADAGRYNDLASSPAAIRHIDAVLPAAAQGRVAELFLAEEGEAWGTMEDGGVSVAESRQMGPELDDLLDLAAHYTLRHGGRVLSMPFEDMPGDATTGVVAALLRS